MCKGWDYSLCYVLCKSCPCNIFMSVWITRALMLQLTFLTGKRACCVLEQRQIKDICLLTEHNCPKWVLLILSCESVLGWVSCSDRAELNMWQQIKADALADSLWKLTWCLVQCTACDHRAALAFACDSSRVLFTAPRAFWKVEGFWLYPCFSGRFAVQEGQRVRLSNCYANPKIVKGRLSSQTRWDMDYDSPILSMV